MRSAWLAPGLLFLSALSCYSQTSEGKPSLIEDNRCGFLWGSTPETHGKLFVAAEPVHQVKPKYPSAARKSHIEGTVVLCATIGKDGNVRYFRVMSGPSELIPSAVKAVEQWRFRPFLANGEPVEGPIRIRVNFRLTGVEVLV